MSEPPQPPRKPTPGWPAEVRRAVDIGPVRPLATHWQIAVEVPVEININGVPFAVMLATPTDLVDLALGFAYSEHLLHDTDGHNRVRVHQHLDGVVLDILAAPTQVNEAARARRHLEGRTGCGLCGIESLAALRARPVRAHPQAQRETADAPAPIEDEVILRALAALASAQPLNRSTHSVHAAAWCNRVGELLTVREDVGRHNALDKLVGARRRGPQTHEPGFVVMSSRLSYELVYKAHAIGASCLAAISAPTSMALDTAALLRLELACLAPAGPGDTPALARFPADAAADVAARNTPSPA